MKFNPIELLNLFFLAYRITGKILFADHWTSEDWMKVLTNEDFYDFLVNLFEEKEAELAEQVEVE